MFINIDFHIRHIPGLDDHVHNKLKYHTQRDYEPWLTRCEYSMDRANVSFTSSRRLGCFRTMRSTLNCDSCA